MLRVAIVEDDAATAQLLAGYLRRYEEESGHKLEITSFGDGDEIAIGYKAGFDLILMDVEMPFMDGMTAAAEIRKQDPEVVIIFITNMAQYAIRGYAVDALDYVLKPVSYFAFSQRLERAIARMGKRAARYITIPVSGGAQKLDVSHIHYIESQGHKLLYHTTGGVFASAGAIGEVEERMEQYHFCRGNKGYLINLAHVDGIRDGCAVVQGELLPLSRARKNAFLEALANYVGEVTR
ncbi:MAG: response regulator transcription factor [Clostridiales bacterium]|nr:response regulator transcription factor [Clostridiales bacterium]